MSGSFVQPTATTTPYSGELDADGLRHGRGICVYGDGTVYDGNWTRDAHHGQGMCRFPSGNVYFGAFRHGSVEGEGCMLYADGDFFCGTFKNAACHGEGLFFSNGRQTQGVWDRGVRISGREVPLASITALGAQRAHTAAFTLLLKQFHDHFVFSTKMPDDAGASRIGTGSAATSLRSFSASPSATSGDEEPLILTVAPVPSSHVPKDLPRQKPQQQQHDQEAKQQQESQQKQQQPKQQQLDEEMQQQQQQQAMPAYQKTAAATAPPKTHLQAPAASSWHFRTSSFNSGSGGFFRSAEAAAQASPSAAAASSGDPPVPVLSLLMKKSSFASTASSPAKAASSSAGTAAQMADNLSLLYSFDGAAGASSHTTAYSGQQPPPPLQAISAPPAAISYALQPQLPPLLLSLREPFAAGAVPRAVLFCSAGPVHNEVFSLSSYLKNLGIFLFPFLALPHVPCCPFAPHTLDMEREYVVSGAALRRDFEVPTVSIYTAAVGISCHIAATVLAAYSHGSFGLYDSVTPVDVAAPFALWATFAAFCAGYNSYVRLAHPLERLDRHFFPTLAAFVAATVDANSSVCIYTWDEDGGSKITNLHYHYRWQLVAFIVASLISFASPVTRVVRGYALFGRDATSSLESASCILCFFSLWIFSAALTYYALKLTDMQREVVAQLRVLSKIAYLRNASIQRPTTQINAKFHFDAPVDLEKPFEGFVGWYFARCHVLCTSTCANHDSRGAAVSVLFLLVVLIACIACGDVVYATAAGTLQHSAAYYSSAHSVGGMVLLTWGPILLRYINICQLGLQERQRHRYLVDVARMYHELHPSYVLAGGGGGSSSNHAEVRASHIIQQCGEMIASHDRCASLFAIPVTAGTFALFAFVLASAVASIGVQLGQAIRVSLWK